MVMDIWRSRQLQPRRFLGDLEEMERSLESPFAGWPLRLMWRRVPNGDDMAWAPSINIYEKEDSYVIQAELPGVNKDDIDISMTGDTLTIKGERKPPAEVKAEDYQCSEVCYGNFSRSINLPSAVDADKIEASCENGMLELQVPKVKEAIPAKIQIKAK